MVLCRLMPVVHVSANDAIPGTTSPRVHTNDVMSISAPSLDVPVVHSHPPLPTRQTSSTTPSIHVVATPCLLNLQPLSATASQFARAQALGLPVPRDGPMTQPLGHVLRIQPARSISPNRAPLSDSTACDLRTRLSASADAAALISVRDPTSRLLLCGTGSSAFSTRPDSAAVSSVGVARAARKKRHALNSSCSSAEPALASQAPAAPTAPGAAAPPSGIICRNQAPPPVQRSDGRGSPDVWSRPRSADRRPPARDGRAEGVGGSTSTRPRAEGPGQRAVRVTTAQWDAASAPVTRWVAEPALTAQWAAQTAPQRAERATAPLARRSGTPAPWAGLELRRPADGGKAVPAEPASAATPQPLPAAASSADAAAPAGAVLPTGASAPAVSATVSQTATFVSVPAPALARAPSTGSTGSAPGSSVSEDAEHSSAPPLDSTGVSLVRITASDPVPPPNASGPPAVHLLSLGTGTEWHWPAEDAAVDRWPPWARRRSAADPLPGQPPPPAACPARIRRRLQPRPASAPGHRATPG